MEPGVADTTLSQGATWRRRFTLSRGNPAVPVDLTGCEARMELRQRVGAPDPADISVSEVPTADGAIVIGGADGTLEVTITAAATTLLSARQYVYDLFVEWPDGDVWKVAKGTIANDRAVTSPTYD